MSVLFVILLELLFTLSLLLSSWCKYFAGVYGEVPNGKGLPICLGDFEVVYKNLMANLKVWGPGPNPAKSCGAGTTSGTQISNAGFDVFPNENRIFQKP